MTSQFTRSNASKCFHFTKCFDHSYSFFVSIQKIQTCNHMYPHLKWWTFVWNILADCQLLNTMPGKCTNACASGTPHDETQPQTNARANICSKTSIRQQLPCVVMWKLYEIITMQAITFCAKMSLTIPALSEGSSLTFRKKIVCPLTSTLNFPLARTLNIRRPDQDD